MPQNDSGGRRSPPVVTTQERETQMLTSIEIQSAIMDTIRSMVQRGGLLSATADNGTEFTFKMNDMGLIAVYTEDEDGDEEEYCFSLEIAED